jgi:hypothetical protein
MQIDVGGASSDNYAKLRRYLHDPSLGAHDPTTAVELAALYLIKFAGAPTGQPIDAYRAAILDYNHDPTYVGRVLADAHAYQGTGTVAFGPPAAPHWERRSCRGPRRGFCRAATRPRGPTLPRPCRR